MTSLTKRKEAPLDPFKRSVTLATRSIAADNKLEVVFTTEAPGLSGKTARVPEPSRVPNKTEIAVIRGHADAAALAVACHDPELHETLAPGGGDARAVFEAIEQARVEAIGARRMRGVAVNLAARIEQRYEKSRFADAKERSEAPLPDALALLVRERLTGLKPPEKARTLVDLWRPFIEGRARAVLDRMPEMLLDQDGFGRLTRELLSALNLADQLEQSENEPDQGGEDQEGQNAEGEDEDAQGEPRSDPSAESHVEQQALSQEMFDAMAESSADPEDRDADFLRAAAPFRSVAPEYVRAR